MEEVKRTAMIIRPVPGGGGIWCPAIAPGRHWAAQREVPHSDEFPKKKDLGHQAADAHDRYSDAEPHVHESKPVIGTVSKLPFGPSAKDV